MLSREFLQDCYGQHYKFVTQQDPIIKAPIEPLFFWDHQGTIQFLQSIDTPYNYWEGLLLEFNCALYLEAVPENDTIQYVADLIISNKIKVYPLAKNDISQTISEKLTLQSDNKTSYSFNHANRLLINAPKEIMLFCDAKEAEEFLTNISISDKKIEEIINELEISNDKNNQVENKSSLRKQFTNHLASGLIIVVKIVASPPPPQVLETIPVSNSIGNRSADLGPHETEEEQIKHSITINIVNELDELYKNIDFTITLSDASEVNISNGESKYTNHELPPGQCKIKFNEFYNQIEQWLKERNR